MSQALTIFRRYVKPHIFSPSCFQIDLIEQTVTDMYVWEQTLVFWLGNGYRERSVQRMLTYYNEQLKQRAASQVGKYIPTGEPTYPDCDTCGNNRKIGWIFHDNGQLNSIDSKPTDCPDCSEERVN